MSRYAIYARLSQDGRKGSIETQIQDCLNYSREHNLPVDEENDIFNDGTFSSGFSSDEERGEAYQEVRELIANGDIDGLIIRDDKRLTRNTGSLYSLFGDFYKHDIELHIAEDGEVDVRDIEGAVHVFSATAQNEDKKKEIERAIEARREKHERGEPLGVPPTGLRYNAEKTAFVAERSIDGSFTQDFLTRYEAIVDKENGASYSEIKEKYGIPRGTMHRVLSKHKEKYLQYSDEVSGAERSAEP